MFEKYIHYIGCFVDNCFTTLNVCNQVQLLWLLLQVKHMYIVCLLLRTITLCVFQPSIYLLCVFDFHWNHIVCFSTIDLFTLRVWLSLESNCMFSHLEFDHFVCLSLKMVTLYVWKNCPCHFECLRLLMFTLCVWIMCLWLCMLFVNYASHFVCFISSDCVFFSAHRGRTKPPHILLALANNNNKQQQQQQHLHLTPRTRTYHGSPHVRY